MSEELLPCPFDDIEKLEKRTGMTVENALCLTAMELREHTNKCLNANTIPIPKEILDEVRGAFGSLIEAIESEFDLDDREPLNTRLILAQETLTKLQAHMEG